MIAEQIEVPEVPAGWDYVGTDCPNDDVEDLEEEASIEEDDWTTPDGCKFYQNGKLILDCTDLSDIWPNVWYVSDHGNVSPFAF